MTNFDKRPILLYDSECSFCTRFAQGVKNLDKDDKVSLISIHDQQIYETFSFLSKEECHNTVHLINSDGEVLKGADVINYLIHIIPTINKLAWLLDNKAGQKALSFFYDKVNEIRKMALIKCPGCNNKER